MVYEEEGFYTDQRNALVTVEDMPTTEQEVVSAEDQDRTENEVVPDENQVRTENEVVPDENHIRTEKEVVPDEDKETTVADVQTSKPKMKLLLKEFNLKKCQKNVKKNQNEVFCLPDEIIWIYGHEQPHDRRTSQLQG